MASLGLLLCPVGAVTYSVMPTVPPSSKESDKEGDLIWYLLTISQQNTNGLGRCQENGGHRGHSLCCMKVPCSAGKCNVRTDTWWPHLHAISQGPRTEASPMSDALQHQDICSMGTISESWVSLSLEITETGEQGPDCGLHSDFHGWCSSGLLPVPGTKSTG